MKDLVIFHGILGFNQNNIKFYRFIVPNPSPYCPMIDTKLTQLYNFPMSKEKQKKEITLDDLALMVAKGFNEVNEKMDKKFKEIETDIKKVKKDTEDIKAEMNKKVDKIEHNTLTYRVEKLEKKFA